MYTRVTIILQLTNYTQIMSNNHEQRYIRNLLEEYMIDNVLKHNIINWCFRLENLNYIYFLIFFTCGDGLDMHVTITLYC